MSTSSVPVVRCAGRTNSAVALGRRTSRRMVTAAAAATARPAAGVCSGSSRSDDYYKVLSLEQSAGVGAAEIKRAYRRLALRHHPDVCPPSRRAESTRLFLELRRAYETLSDPARRVRYDAGLMMGAPAGGEPPARPFGGAELARDVWEAQLGVLRARSERRQRERTSRGSRPC